MSRVTDDLARSTMAGVSTGARTFTALATLTATARPDADGRPDSVLAKPWAKGIVGLLAITELVMDKLPNTPSRLEAVGLSGRLVAGAACGAIIARRGPDPGLTGWPNDPAVDVANDPTALPSDPVDNRNRTIACALAGLASAAATSWAGVHWRAAATSRFGRDWVGAGLEDAATIGLAAAAARAR